MYVCQVGEGGGREGGRGGCVGVIVWVGVDVIAWVWKGVCGWYSLNCCCKVCMCVGGEGEGGSVGGSVCGCDCVGVGVIVCGCDCVGVEGSVWVCVVLIAAVKYVCVSGGGKEGGREGGRGVCVGVTVWVWV